jgi:heme/copper-type cytochrome/quinol oxidase subunit 3
MNTLRLLLDLCLLRGRAQDLPASMQLVWLTAATSVVVDVLSLPDGGADLGRILFVASQVVLFGATIWLVLKLRGFPERWMQTISALYAANTAFSVLLLPMLPALMAMYEGGPGTPVGWQAYVMLAVTGWFLVVTARVLREATEWPLLPSFLVSIACITVVRAAGLVLAPLFGLAVQA